MVFTKSNQRSKTPSAPQEDLEIEMQSIQIEQSKPKRSQENKKRERDTGFEVNPKDYGLVSTYIANTPDSEEGLSYAITKEYIPLQTATPTLMPTFALPTPFSQLELQRPILYTQMGVEDGTQAAPLDGGSSIRQQCRGCNHNLVYKQNKKNKNQGKRIQQSDVTQGVELIKNANDKQKEVVKEIGFGDFLNYESYHRGYYVPVAHDRLRVTEHDVYMTLAIPKCPLEVTEAENKTNSTTEFKSLPKGEDFKTNFILLVVSTCNNLCYLDRVVFKVRSVPHQFSTLRGWTNGKIKSREEEEFEVRFGRRALEDQLDKTKAPDEAQEVHKEEPSNTTPETAAESEHETVQSKIKIYDPVLLEDGKKTSNEIITNSRMLAGVMTELEKLLPEAHASLKRVRTTAVQITSDAMFAHITLPGKSKSTTPTLPPDSCTSEGFLLEVEAIKKQFLNAQKEQA
ncbi:LOW QUALITY PROTEIN: hypothetical protein Cgig2_008573 [Carnegiea gigantea]|uniref:Uncharacterized protein n=1 Tax=Carnegiea gigantea TaxID=171969 RepID=A0A9Q1GUI0_9CARY|nr:LOW QUALITY PROTEIN: hypothetical protein Cgig2_008573 [Carnegiea gigantea]